MGVEVESRAAISHQVWFAVCSVPVGLMVKRSGWSSTAVRRSAVRNRVKVLAAAAETLYRTRGVDGVSMDDIAAEAGVGKGTLYRYFVDKSALVAALLDNP